MREDLDVLPEMNQSKHSIIQESRKVISDGSYERMTSSELRKRLKELRSICSESFAERRNYLAFDIATYQAELSKRNGKMILLFTVIAVCISALGLIVGLLDVFR